MIGLGSQYLTAAGFGRYRITAASLGNLDLLVRNWLKPATKQAILGAFGADGLAVIKATNAYLNGIAASDRDKATALAALLNEDPMMVCSLGLQPQLTTLSGMPVRCADNQGTSYIDTPISAAGNIELRLTFVKLRLESNFVSIFGTSKSRYLGFEPYVWNGNQGMQICIGTTDSNRLWNIPMSTVGSSGVFTVTRIGNDFTIVGEASDGTERTSTGTNAYTVPSGSVFTIGKSDGYYPQGRAGYGELYFKNSVGEYWYMPIRRNGNMEFVDVLTGNLFTRVGTFTEAFYLPDGTPWTPSTP